MRDSSNAAKPQTKGIAYFSELIKVCSLFEKNE